MVIRILRSIFGGKPASPRSDPLNPARPIYTYPEGPAPFAPPTEGEDSCAAITAHVERHIGPCTHVLHERISDTVHIDVIPIPPSEAQPFWTIVTSGMSDLPMTPMTGAEACRYAELIMRLPPDWPFPDLNDDDMSVWSDERHYWPVRILKTLAGFPHKYRSWLWTGHTLDIGKPGEMAPGTGFSSVVLLPPMTLPREVWTLPVSADKTIHFFNVIPLYPEEAALTRERGLDGLLDVFPDNPEDIDILHPQRPTLVPHTP